MSSAQLSSAQPSQFYTSDSSLFLCDKVPQAQRGFVSGVSFLGLPKKDIPLHSDCGSVSVVVNKLTYHMSAAVDSYLLLISTLISLLALTVTLTLNKFTR